MSEGIRPQNWSAHAGESIELPVAVSNADKTPTNLAGCVSRFGLFPMNGTDPVVASYGASPNATSSVTVPSTGQVLNKIASDVSIALLGTYRWECEVDDVFGNRVVVAYGFATFRQKLIN